MSPSSGLNLSILDLGNLASEEGRYMELPHDLIQKGVYSICGVKISVLLVPTVLSCRRD